MKTKENRNCGHINKLLAEAEALREISELLLVSRAQTAPDLLPCQRIASKAPAGPKPGWMPKGG